MVFFGAGQVPTTTTLPSSMVIPTCVIPEELDCREVEAALLSFEEKLVFLESLEDFRKVMLMLKWEYIRMSSI